PAQATAERETGPVRLVVRPRTRTTQFPCLKAQESSTVSTGSNRKFPIVAPPPPPSVPGKIGEFSSPFFCVIFNQGFVSRNRYFR
ncbi:unnamed protein product, partial [Prunus brigantina]